MGLRGLSQRYFILLTSALLLASCYGRYLNKEDFEKAFNDRGDSDEDDDCSRTCEGDWPGLSTGAIVGIVIGVLIIFFGIPICICFCCAWCCFAACRKSKTSSTQVVVAAPMPQYQQQPPHNPTVIYNPRATPNGGPSAPYPAQEYGSFSPYANMNLADNESNLLNKEPPPPYYAATATVSPMNAPPPQEPSSQELGWKGNLS